MQVIVYAIFGAALSATSAVMLDDLHKIGIAVGCGLMAVGMFMLSAAHVIADKMSEADKPSE